MTAVRRTEDGSRCAQDLTTPITGDRSHLDVAPTSQLRSLSQHRRTSCAAPRKRVQPLTHLPYRLIHFVEQEEARGNCLRFEVLLRQTSQGQGPVPRHDEINPFLHRHQSYLAPPIDKIVRFDSQAMLHPGQSQEPHVQDLNPLIATTSQHRKEGFYVARRFLWAGILPFATGQPPRGGGSHAVALWRGPLANGPS